MKKAVHNGLVRAGRIAAVAAMIGCCGATVLTVGKVAVALVCIGWLFLSMVAEEM